MRSAPFLVASHAAVVRCGHRGPVREAAYALARDLRPTPELDAYPHIAA